MKPPRQLGVALAVPTVLILVASIIGCGGGGQPPLRIGDIRTCLEEGGVSEIDASSYRRGIEGSIYGQTPSGAYFELDLTAPIGGNEGGVAKMKTQPLLGQRATPSDKDLLASCTS